MRTIDSDGLFLCKLQAKIFENSNNYVNTSSEIFIRRFMNSTFVIDFDKLIYLDRIIDYKDVYELIDNEYGTSNYGKNKYNSEVLYWIGYFYRYFSYTYELSSKQVFKIIKPKELNEMYYIYHTYDCSKAIELILELKNILFNELDINDKLFKLFRNNKYMENISIKQLTNDEFNNVTNNTLYIIKEENDYLLKENSVFDNIKLEDVVLSIMDKGVIIGDVTISNIINNKAELNICLNNEYDRNKGKGSIALSKTIEYVKSNLDLKAICATIIKNDERCIHVFKKCGFKYYDEDSNYVYLKYKIV